VELPEKRSTNDLDLFLHTEIMVDGKKLKRIRNILDERKYRTIKGVEYLSDSEKKKLIFMRTLH
jgi:hypothetical protein